MIAVALAMAAVVAFSGIVLTADDGDAAYEEDYGEIYNMKLAQGYSYRYTPSYPAGLEVETTILKHESGLEAEMQGGTLVVMLSESATIGQSYDLVLQAHSSTAGVEQTIYQHMRFTAVNGLTVPASQVINDIILGAELTFQAQASTDAETPGGEPMTITWSVKSGTELPAGLSLSGNTVSGEPTTVGKNTVSLTASSAGQTADLIIDFTVWQKIVAQEDETIQSYGNTVSSTIKAQTVSAGEDKSGDLTVTWAVASDSTDQLPTGFELDLETGIISGASNEAKTSVVKIVGTTTAESGPQQSVTKTVTICSEPIIVISTESGSNSIFTYATAEPVQVQMKVNEGVSDVTWSVLALSGITIDAETGILTVTNEAQAGNFNVTAKSAYGQEKTQQFTIVYEEPLIISGSNTLATSTDKEGSTTYTCNVEGVTWSVEDVPLGTNVTIDPQTGVMKLSDNNPAGPFVVTVKATSTNGQSAEYEVTVQVIPQLIFADLPSGGVIAYAI